MKITLYEHEFNITEANICEARAKYLISSALGNSVGLLKRESIKCESVNKMLSHTPKIAGALLLNMTKHLLYVLRQEGVTMNAQDYLSATFTYYDSALQNVCKSLKSKPNVTKNIAVNELTKATMLDLFELWRGYSQAHGYDAKNEFYTVEKLHRAEESVGKFYSTFEKKSTDAKKNAEDMLRNAILNHLHKNVIQKENNIPVQTFVQALYDAPYVDWLYKATRLWLDESVGLEKYHSYFRSNFKSGSYRDINADPPTLQPSSEELDRVENENKIKKILREWHNAYVTSYVKLHSSIYFYDDEQSKSKFDKATSTYAHLQKNEVPLIYYDTTKNGTADKGLLLTTRGIYIRNAKDTDTKFFSHKSTPSIELLGTSNEDLDLFINDIQIDKPHISDKELKNFFGVLLLIEFKTETPTEELTAATSKLWQILFVNDSISVTKDKSTSESPKQTNASVKSKLADVLKKLKILQSIPQFNMSGLYYYCDEKNKSKEKFAKALASYVHLKNGESKGEYPLICYDDTMFGSAEDGFTVTTTGIYWHNLGEDGEFLVEFPDLDLKHVKKNLYFNDMKISTAGLNEKEVENLRELIDRLRNMFASSDSPTSNNVPRGNNSEISDDELALRIKEILPTWRNTKKFNFKSHIYYYGDTGKSEQKFQNALKSYVHLKKAEVPLICYDSTTFGGADEGLTMTTEGIHICKDSGSAPIFISHDKLSKIELRGFLSKDLYINDIKIDKSGLSSSQLSAFCEILQMLHDRIADLIAEFNQ